jgi:hypothetical protein
LNIVLRSFTSVLKALTKWKRLARRGRALRLQQLQLEQQTTVDANLDNSEPVEVVDNDHHQTSDQYTFANGKYFDLLGCFQFRSQTEMPFSGFSRRDFIGIRDFQSWMIPSRKFDNLFILKNEKFHFNIKFANISSYTYNFDLLVHNQPTSSLKTQLSPISIQPISFDLNAMNIDIPITSSNDSSIANLHNIHFDNFRRRRHRRFIVGNQIKQTTSMTAVDNSDISRSLTPETVNYTTIDNGNVRMSNNSTVIVMNDDNVTK